MDKCICGPHVERGRTFFFFFYNSVLLYAPMATRPKKTFYTLPYHSSPSLIFPFPPWGNMPSKIIKWDLELRCHCFISPLAGGHFTAMLVSTNNNINCPLRLFLFCYIYVISSLWGCIVLFWKDWAHVRLFLNEDLFLQAYWTFFSHLSGGPNPVWFVYKFALASDSDHLQLWSDRPKCAHLGLFPPLWLDQPPRGRIWN